MYKMVHMKRTGEPVKVVELKRKRMKQKGTKLRQEKDYLKKVDVKKRTTIVAQTKDAGVKA
jgi:hypothetical protein